MDIHNQTNKEPEHTTSEDVQNEKDSQETPKVKHGSLVNAVLRIFKTDATMAFPEKKTEIENIVPKAQENSEEKELQNETTEKKETRSEAVVHTFGDDVQNLVRSKKMSIAKIAALESDTQKKKEELIKQKDPWKASVFISLTVITLLVSIAITIGGYYAYKLNTSTQVQTHLDKSMFFVEKRQKIDLADRPPHQLLEFLSNVRGSSFFVPGTATELYATKVLDPKTIQQETVVKHLSAKEFFHTLFTSAPKGFTDYISDPYMFGIYVTDSGNNPFIVTTVSSYNYAFSGILEWEKTMLSDTSPLFSDAHKQPTKNQFIDEVYNNMDLRVLYSDTHKPLLLYSFINNSTLIITTDKKTLKEIANRIKVAK